MEEEFALTELFNAVGAVGGGEAAAAGAFAGALIALYDKVLDRWVPRS